MSGQELPLHELPFHELPLRGQLRSDFADRCAIWCPRNGLTILPNSRASSTVDSSKMGTYAILGVNVEQPPVGLRKSSRRFARVSRQMPFSLLREALGARNDAHEHENESGV